MVGIEKEGDALGRVVIPIEYRKSLGIEANTKVFITLENNALFISPAKACCALCGKPTQESSGIRLCEDCIKKVKYGK